MPRPERPMPQAPEGVARAGLSPAGGGWLSHPVLARSMPPFLLLAAMTAAGSAATHTILPALPTIAGALGVGNGVIQLAVTLYLVGTAIGQLIYGPLSDRFGRRPVVICGMALFSAGCLLGAVASSFGMLLLARIVQSLGGCAGLVLGRAMVRDTASPTEAAARLALLMVLMVMAPAGGPLVGGYTMVWFGWRAIFVLMLAIGLAVMAWSLLALPETNPNRGATRGIADMARQHLRLLGNRQFDALVMIGASVTGASYAFFSSFPFIFTRVLHRPVETIGFWYIFVLAGYWIGGLLANRLAGRFPSRPITVAGVALSWSCCVIDLGLILTGHLSLIGMLVTILGYTLGSSLAGPFAATAAISQQPGAIGTASGIYGFAQMAWAALCTLAVSLWSDGTAVPMGVIMLGSVCISLALLLRRGDRRGGAPPMPA